MKIITFITKTFNFRFLCAFFKIIILIKVHKHKFNVDLISFVIIIILLIHLDFFFFFLFIQSVRYYTSAATVQSKKTGYFILMHKK